MTTHELQLGDQRAQVSTHGGRLVSYAVDGWELLAGQENPSRFGYRGSVLAPWPNRVAGGRWTWQGRELRLPVNDPDSQSALHGLAVDVTFEAANVTATAVELGYDLPPHEGYPFALRITAAYALTPDGLVCSLSARNTGSGDAPVGLGVHPYLAAPEYVDDLVLTVPADTVWEGNAAWEETGRQPVGATGLDFRTPRRLGATVLDTVFTDLQPEGSGRTATRIGLPDGAGVSVWAGPTARWWLLYSADTLAPGDQRRSLAVEPMTCPPNALNSGEIDRLAPGETLSLDWGITLTPPLP